MLAQSRLRADGRQSVWSRARWLFRREGSQGAGQAEQGRAPQVALRHFAAHRRRQRREGRGEVRALSEDEGRMTATMREVCKEHTMPRSELSRIAILGAGPIGLEA